MPPSNAVQRGVRLPVGVAITAARARAARARVVTLQEHQLFEDHALSKHEVAELLKQRWEAGQFVRDCVSEGFDWDG